MLTLFGAPQGSLSLTFGGVLSAMTPFSEPPFISKNPSDGKNDSKVSLSLFFRRVSPVFRSCFRCVFAEEAMLLVLLWWIFFAFSGLPLYIFCFSFFLGLCFCSLGSSAGEFYRREESTFRITSFIFPPFDSQKILFQFSQCKKITCFYYIYLFLFLYFVLMNG